MTTPLQGDSRVCTVSLRSVHRLVRDLSRADLGRVGGKNASLGEMLQQLLPRGVRVPRGFATTAAAYRACVEANGITEALAARVAALKSGASTLHETGEAARGLFLNGEFPHAVAQEMRAAYQALSRRYGGVEASVAVRSSATAEDLPGASFVGQLETFLNVRGQAPSNFPEFASLLVNCGIDSISLNPDSFVAAVRNVAQSEQLLSARVAAA